VQLGVGTALLYVVMIICVFRALDSFFMLHDTKAAIEKIFFDGKWLQRGRKKSLTNPVFSDG
jgi:hypothetical protein